MSGTAIDGAWQMEEYVVGGAATALNGLLLLAAGHWATVYFVPGPAGDWGSAEAGTFDVDDGRLTFNHRQLFQGGGGREVVMTRDEKRIEVCRLDVDGERMQIHFPSGNTLRLKRAR